jgi:hypothetical protein
MLGQHIGVLIDDRDRRGAARSSYGTLEVADLRATGQAHRGFAGSQRPPATVRTARRRAHRRLVDGRDPHAHRRARAARRLHAHARIPAAHVPPVPRRRCDSSQHLAGGAAARRRSARRTRVAAGKPDTALFAGRYENSVIVAAAAPSTRPTARVFGVIQLAQTADRWLTLRDRALTRLLNLTLFVTLFAVVAAFWFAGRMTLRISRLGAASETALGARATCRACFPKPRPATSSATCSRSFSSLLGRPR